MKKAFCYFAGTLLFMASSIMLIRSALNPGFLNDRLARRWERAFGIGSDEEGAAARALIEHDYSVSFDYPKRTPDTMSLYIPEYDYLEENRAGIYLSLFDAEGWEREDGGEDVYAYAGNEGRLTVNKYYNQIKMEFFEKSGTRSRRDASLDSEGALTAALSYIEGHLLPSDFAHSKVSYKNGQFTVTFYDKIGGALNHGHTVTVVVDGTGFVKSMDYYRLSYEKLSGVKVISMEEAYYKLPPLAELGIYGENFDGELAADLSQCALVYTFEDSILQPAYLFEGEVINRRDGTVIPYKQYINAAKYK